jgi:hypothetical protein
MGLWNKSCKRNFKLKKIKSKPLIKKQCQYPNCDIKFMGISISKFCKEHRKNIYREKKIIEREDVSVKNLVFEHSHQHIITKKLNCALEGCSKEFEISVYPTQKVYPKFCSEHRNDFQRKLFIEKNKMANNKKLNDNIKENKMIVDTDELKNLLEANKLVNKDSEELKKFEENLEVVEYVWSNIQQTNQKKEGLMAEDVSVTNDVSVPVETTETVVKAKRAPKVELKLNVPESVTVKVAKCGISATSGKKRLWKRGNTIEVTEIIDVTTLEAVSEEFIKKNHLGATKMRGKIKTQEELDEIVTKLFA